MRILLCLFLFFFPGSAYADTDGTTAAATTAAATTAAATTAAATTAAATTAAATHTESLETWHRSRFQRLRARLRLATGGTDIQFTSPVKKEHSVNIPIFRNLEVPTPPPKVLPKKVILPGAKPCGETGTPEAKCYGHGKCRCVHKFLNFFFENVF